MGFSVISFVFNSLESNMPRLAEERTFAVEFDQPALELDPPFADDTCDWGSDPMEILMAKQERERNELQYMLELPRH